jgi:allantoin racemase
LQEALGVPVIEGVSVAVKLVEGLVTLGLSTSKGGGLAYPPAKAWTGPAAGFRFGGGR